MFQPFQRLTTFWSNYTSGLLSHLPDFSAAVAAERVSSDAPNTSTERFFETFKDGVQWDAPERLRFPSSFTSDTQLRFHDRADWQHVHPSIRLFAARLIEACRQRGIPMYVHGAFRTKEEQQRAFADGNSKLQWPRAAHCQGKAVDVVHGIYHWSMTNQEWSLIGKIGYEVARKMRAEEPKTIQTPLGPKPNPRHLEVLWGGDFGLPNHQRDDDDPKTIGWDPAHWEILNWQDQPILKHPTGAPLRLTPRKILTMK